MKDFINCFKKELTIKSLYDIIALLSSNVDGRIAQLGEHLPYKQRVIGSSPIGPINMPTWLNGRAADL